MSAMRVLAFAIGAGFAAAGAARADDAPQAADALKEDVQKLQGKWEYTGKDNVGIPLTVRREVKDNTMRITFFVDGSVRSACSVEFKLEMKGKDKVFSCFNGKTVEGLGKGLRFRDGSFAYTLEGDTWTEIGESGQKFAWKRVKDREKK